MKWKRPGFGEFERTAKKLCKQVAALQKQVTESLQLLQICAALKENNEASKSSLENKDDNHMSMAGKIMKILDHKKKQSS